MFIYVRSVRQFYSYHFVIVMIFSLNACTLYCIHYSDVVYMSILAYRPQNPLSSVCRVYIVEKTVTKGGQQTHY